MDDTMGQLMGDSMTWGTSHRAHHGTSHGGHQGISNGGHHGTSYGGHHGTNFGGHHGTSHRGHHEVGDIPWVTPRDIPWGTFRGGPHRTKDHPVVDLVGRRGRGAPHGDAVGQEGMPWGAVGRRGAHRRSGRAACASQRGGSSVGSCRSPGSSSSGRSSSPAGATRSPGTQASGRPLYSLWVPPTPGTPRLFRGPRRPAHHQQVVEEEDLALVQPQALGPVGVGDLVELTAAHQAPVGQGQHLRVGVGSAWGGASGGHTHPASRPIP